MFTVMHTTIKHVGLLYYCNYFDNTLDILTSSTYYLILLAIGDQRLIDRGIHVQIDPIFWDMFKIKGASWSEALSTISPPNI